MIYVGSLEYSPVYKSHCCAFGKACEELGYQVKYLFSRKYEWLLPQSIKEKTIFIGNSTSISSMLQDSLIFKNRNLIAKAFSMDKPTHVYIHNYHLLNHYIASCCKKNNSKFIYHVHEPMVEKKSYHGGFQQYWLYLNEFMDSRLVHNTDIAVVSSKEGLRLFNKAYPWFKGKKLEIPLLYEDLGTKEEIIRSQKIVTFVGPPVPAKGPEILASIADYASKYFPEWIFMLISRQKIKNPLLIGRNNLSVYYKEFISDEEYGDLMKRSSVVLTPYKRETQSSVVLVSYMYGTPVVSSNVGGMPEFVKNGETGYLVDINAPVEEWVKAINSAMHNSQKLSIRCRSFFVNNFSGNNWKRHIKKILD
jgi:glycosyltransferase involved in cell wall biosynthesis